VTKAEHLLPGLLSHDAFALALIVIDHCKAESRDKLALLERVGDIKLHHGQLVQHLLEESNA